MSKRHFITLRTRNSNEEVDIELPGDQPITDLMPDLLKVLNWPLTSGNSPLHYCLETEAGDRLQSSQTFRNAGVANFDVLWIMLDETQPKPAGEALDDGGRLPGQGSHTISEGEDQGGILPPPLWARIPIDEPCLVSNSGVVFVLGQPPITIGRRSRDFIPQIDLTELDTSFISSRRHAEIVIKEDNYILQALNTKNGMFINGKEFKPGECCSLKNDDVLQFGFRGIQLVLMMPH